MFKVKNNSIIVKQTRCNWRHLRTTIFHKRHVILYFLDLSTFMLQIDQFYGNKRTALINEIVHWALWFDANIKIRIASCVSNIYLLQFIAWGMCLERTFIIQLGKLSILVFFLFFRIVLFQKLLPQAEAGCCLLMLCIMHNH